MAKKKCLVVYYSVSGNTEKVAETIAEKLGADIYRIEDSVKRKGFLGFMRTGFQSVFKKSVPISEGTQKVGDYDMVLIGSPTYAGNIAPGLRTFIQKNKELFKSVAYFGTGGDKKRESVLSALEREVRMAAKGRLYLCDKLVKNGEYADKVEEFVSALQ